MKKKRYLILLMIALLFNITRVNAIDNKENITGSISGKYIYENRVFKDKDIYLYNIADLNEDYKFDYLEKYQEFNVDINSIPKDNWKDYLDKILEYITNNNIGYDYNIKTDESGIFSFKDLQPGLYVLMADEEKDSLYKYSTNISLISIPNLDVVTNEYLYDQTIEMKIEKEIIEKPTEKTTNKKPTGNIDVPQTSDNILFYIIMFVVSLILLISIIIFYILKSRKDDKDEEEQNK